ncbi:MAG: hypothetical protein IT379_36270, partial [Deltaproteobacteria bacterium]|nr:hypothetical protein [Deltaproteobacteria bacterium]
MKGARAASLAATLLLACAGCSSQSETAILLEVTSSLPVPDEIDQLEIGVVGEETGSMLADRFDLAASWPQTLTVLPARSERERVLITVTGRLRAGSGEPIGAFVVRRVTGSAFVPDELTRVSVELSPECVGVRCNEGIDCVGGECADGMPIVDSGPRDSGPGDAGPRDTGVRDATPDAGPVDAGPDMSMCDPTACDDGDPCTDAVCRGTDCVLVTHDGDGDGHGDAACDEVGGVPADDCDDDDAMVFPGAPDVCNGGDDDCDTECDESSTCCRGETGSCTTSCGTMGSRVCDLSCGWGTCAPPAETCNGMDDDCNGECDDGVGCCRGATTTCRTSCGSSGTTVCSMDCVPGACTAPPETCNGADDDCDGTADDGFACEAGSSSPCMTSCGSVGSAPCQADCTRGACRPPPETCGNGVDEDCDSMVDEGCMAGCTGTCADAVEVALPGARATAMPSADTASGSCGGAGGADARFTFTITTRSDVFVTTHGSGLDTVVYVRGCACDGTEVGCNDDADGQTSSALSLVDLPGGTYTVFVDTKAAMSVSVSVDILVTPTGQEGDRCGRPLPLVGPTVAGNTCGLTSDNSGPCEYVGSLDGPDRVYYLVVTSTRSVTLDTC